jgi:hypothetical protein
LFDITKITTDLGYEKTSDVIIGIRPMGKIKRYRSLGSDPTHHPHLVEHSFGGWVKFADYEKVRDALRALYAATECDIADAGAYDADVEKAILTARELLSQ